MRELITAYNIQYVNGYSGLKFSCESQVKGIKLRGFNKQMATMDTVMTTDEITRNIQGKTGEKDRNVWNTNI